MLATRMMMGASSAAPVEVTFRASAVSAANATEYTFSSQPLGSGTRKIAIVPTQIGSNRTIDAVTADGSSMTSAVTTTPPTSDRMSIFYLDATTEGSTGDVVVTMSGAASNCGIGIFTLANAASGAPTDTAEVVDEGSPTSVNTTVNCDANGAIIGGVYAKWSADRTFSWTNLANESYDEFVETSVGGHSGAFEEFATAQTNRSITATASAGTQRMGMVLASWGPK